MAQDPNPNVTIPGSGVLLHVLNTSGEPIPVQGDDDGAIETVGGGGGGGGAVTQSTGNTATPWYMQGVNGGVAERLATYAAQTDRSAKTQISNGTNEAAVTNAAPTTEYGIVTRNIPSGTQPVSDAGGSLTVDSAQLPAALGAGGGIKVDGSGTALPVSGPLTDVELRASAVPVSATQSGTWTEANSSTIATNTSNVFDRLDPLWSAAYTSLVGTKTAKTITLFGRRTSATFNNATQYHDLYSYLTTDIAGSDLTGSEALEVVSSSANDTSAGTGARTLAYAYIDALAGDIETVATVTMNGTTPVALGAGVRAKNIQWLEVRTAGSTNHNDGTITLRTAGAGTTWEQIPAFQRRSLSARYMVPAGFTAFVKALRFTAISQRMDIALLATESESGAALTNVYVPHHLSNIPSNVAGPAIETPYHRFSAGTRLKISAIAAATAGSPIAEAEFTLLTVQN